VTLEPILQASPAVQAHLAAIAGAFVLGTWNIIGIKGTPAHRLRGRVYLLLMIAAALTSFGIQGMNKGGFSFLHLLSLFVLVMVPYGWWSARTGRLRAHRHTMIGLYVGGLWIPGLLTLLPGRLLHQVLFSS
jgi:uncharacterized membrane protein